MAINNSLSNQCFCNTKSALDKNLKAKANSKNPKETLTVFNQPPDFGIAFNQPGNMANNINGKAIAKENPNIPQIATCVLVSLDINYAPNGWAAYETPGENEPYLGRTGMPVSIQATLQFQEMTYLTKADFRDDFANADTLARGR